MRPDRARPRRALAAFQIMVTLMGSVTRAAIPCGICLLASLAAANPCAAGGVVVIVRDTAGAPVAGERLTLHPPLEPGEQMWSLRIRELSVSRSTDRDGRASFEGIAPGQYTVSFLSLSNPRLVEPENNPYAAVPVVTVGEGEEPVTLEIRLETGITVVCRMEADSRAPVFGTVWVREIDHEFRRTEVIGNVDDEEYVLVPGRWELVLEPPPGFLLRDVEVDGRSIEGDRALLELEPSRSTNFVTWRLAPPTAELKGSVRFDGPPTGVEIHARLLEPGAWIEGMRGSLEDVAVAAVDFRTSKYSVMVQDGRWELQAVGDHVVSAQPESAVVSLAPGGVENVDFVVETEGSGSELVVRVLDPRGKEVAGATVEVRTLDDARPDVEPLHRTRTVESGVVFIPGLPAGDLVVAAGHPDYIDAETEVLDFDPEEKPPPRVEVQLKTGATLHVVAADSDDRPVSGVRLELVRMDDGPQTKISDPELLATTLRKRASTDATGHAWIRGIWPGPHRLSGRLEGSRSTTGFVRILDNDRPVEELVILVSEGEELELRARVLPAATFEARLHCSRAQPLPGKASAAVVPATADLEALDDPAWLKESELVLEDVPLSGEKHDVIGVGPLEEGAYRLALRPSGHDRWTWALGTERASESAILHGAPGEPVDLEAVPIDCGPAIEIRLGVAGDGPVPSLSLVHPRYDAFSIAGVVRSDSREHTVDQAVVDAYTERLVVRDLPEGSAKLQIGLRHPYFLPSPWITIPVQATLERGRTVEMQWMASAFGGALVVVHRAAAVRLSGTKTHPRVVPLQDGRVEIPSLLPGLYRLELCSDAACKRALETRDGLEIRALETTEVR